jgi:hypothetical protein
MLILGKNGPKRGGNTVKVKMVQQFGCDFCKKKMYRRDAMVTHEKHCTMNPDRYCRMCDKIEDDEYHSGHRELIEMIPRPIETTEEFPLDELGNRMDRRACIRVDHDDEGFVSIYWENYEDICDAFADVRRKTNCPACLFAVLRQTGLIGHVEFDYTKECDLFWADFKQDYGCY